jgi:hypothetical protein
MTGPGTADASRMRIAGIVLLALAGVAAVVGLLTLGGGGPSTTNTAGPASAEPLPGAGNVSPPPAPPVAPPPAGPAPVSPPPEGPPVAAAPIVVPDGSADGDAGGGSGAGGSPATVPVRVLNNSTITGLADRAAGDMRAKGWNVVEVGNYPNGVIPVSTVYYRPGTDEQAAADTVASELGIRSAPRFDGIEQASPGLIVIATSNWGQNAS